MAFDWIRFLNQYSIEYVTQGPNVAKGNVNIHCPYCGASDPSHHMGISLSGKGWACWRSETHRGKNPRRLVEVLLGCSREQASRIVGDTAPPLPERENFAGRVRQSLGIRQRTRTVQRYLTMPREFKPIRNRGAGREFFHYLRVSRKYPDDDIPDLVRRYDLRYCTSGQFRNRLIIPVSTELGLTTWVGRTIKRSQSPRYKALTVDPDKVGGGPLALRPVNRCLFNYPSLMRDPGSVLVIVEGPMDALRVDYYGYEYGIRATCLFGLNLFDEHLALLQNLAPLYRRRILMLDRGETVSAMRIGMRLSHLRFDYKTSPSSVKDPAEMTPRQILKIFN